MKKIFGFVVAYLTTYIPKSIVLGIVAKEIALGTVVKVIAMRYVIKRNNLGDEITILNDINIREEKISTDANTNFKNKIIEYDNQLEELKKEKRKKKNNRHK